MNLEYILYGVAAAAAVGVIFAFKRDALIRRRRMGQIAALNSAIPAATSYHNAANEVDSTFAGIINDDGSPSFLDKYASASYMSSGGEPNGLAGGHSVMNDNMMSDPFN